MMAFYWLYLWQLKEYRTDRMWSYLSSLSLVQICVEWLLGKRRYPRRTAKLLMISGVSVSVEFFVIVLLFFLSQSFVFTFVVGYLLIPLSISLAVILFSVPSSYYKNRLLAKATQYRALFPKLKVIVVTGSYGKTSTKEAIATVLSQKFTVLKTKGGENVDIAIARQILAELTDQIEIYVVEAGAYKVGEIAQIMAMVQPQIGVLTGINEQHVELFGGINNTIIAKSEVILNLPPDGIGVVNSGDGIVERQRRLFEQTGRTILTYSSQHPDENIRAAKVIGQLFAMSVDQVTAGIAAIAPAQHRHVTFKNNDGIYVIDDSYNSNPAGFAVALDVLKKNPASVKVIVTTGIYELGVEAKAVHVGLEQQMNEMNAIVFLTEKAHKHLLPSSRFITQASIVKALLQKQPDTTAILLEGRSRINQELLEYLHD